MSKNRQSFGVVQDHNIVTAHFRPKAAEARCWIISSNIERDKSFVYDLNIERGTVRVRVAFVPRSAEVKPLFLRFVTFIPFPSFLSPNLRGFLFYLCCFCSLSFWLTIFLKKIRFLQYGGLGRQAGWDHCCLFTLLGTCENIQSESHYIITGDQASILGQRTATL